MTDILPKGKNEQTGGYRFDEKTKKYLSGSV